MKILVLNGPNLNLLGIREPSIYGKKDIGSLMKGLVSYGQKLGVEVVHFQSNCEGALIDKLHDAIDVFDGIIFNPGAYTHYSYALRDAIVSIAIPVVEVHISNIYARESFRSNSVIAPVCIGQISGMGAKGYNLALEFLTEFV